MLSLHWLIRLHFFYMVDVTHLFHNFHFSSFLQVYNCSSLCSTNPCLLWLSVYSNLRHLTKHVNVYYQEKTFLAFLRCHRHRLSSFISSHFHLATIKHKQIEWGFLYYYTVVSYIRIRACCSCNRRIRHVIIDCGFCLQFVAWIRVDDHHHHHTFVF